MPAEQGLIDLVDLAAYTMSFFSLLITILLLVVFSYLFREKQLFSREKIFQQLILVAIFAVGLIFIIFTLPLDIDTKNLLITLLGIVSGATIAFSSSTFISNAMAGIMLRLIKPFRIGDYIKINDTFGRVTEINFLHTQIQSQERDLVTIPNIALVSHPLKTIRTSGTIISTELSLGYNVSRKKIEKNLLIAAEKAKLENPFVHITELGDFSIKYKVGGLQKDVGSLITARSDFKKYVVDALHGNGIEIVSPTFMNQRQLQENYISIPSVEEESAYEAEMRENVPEKTTEEVIFDRAIEAENLDKIQNTMQSIHDRNKAMEEKARTILDANRKQRFMLEIDVLKEEEENLKPGVEDLKKLPDFTRDIEDQEKEKIIETIKSMMARSDELESRQKKLAQRIETVLIREGKMT
jgi:small-conductance mechanosensitive channel